MNLGSLRVQHLITALLAGMCLAMVLAPNARAAYGDGVLKVLVMGDSYSAGNGAGQYAGPKGCRRSGNNYAGTFTTLVQQAPYLQTATIDNVACSGARTSAFTSGQGSRSRQLDEVDATYDVIFLTLGGNDLNFADIVKFCLIAKTRDGANCGPLLRQAERALKQGALEGRIRSILSAIAQQAASGTRIVLLGYPYLEGDPGYTLRSGHFGKTFIAVGKRLRALQERGDRVQARAVSEAAPGGASMVFVPTKDLFAGPPDHGLFAKSNNPERWFVQPFVDASVASRDTWYHPNPAGWDAEARLLLADPRIPSFDAGNGEIRFVGALYERFVISFSDGRLDLPTIEREAPPSVMPELIKFGSGQGFGSLTWRGWGRETTVGTGTYRNHSWDQTPGTVTLSQPRQCGKFRLYTVARFSYETPAPEGGTRPEALDITPSC